MTTAHSMIADPDQWARCAHTDTVLGEGGVVSLDWQEIKPSPSGDRDGPSGLAFDAWCRAYRSDPRHGRVHLLNATRDDIHGSARGSPRPGLLRAPRGLALDTAQRLYVAESAGGAVHVVDVRGERPVRRVPVRDTRHRRRRPVDVAAACCGAVVLVTEPAGLVLLEGRRGPRPGPDLRRPRGSRGMRPARLTTDRDRVLVLWADPTAARALIATADGDIQVTVPGATDLEMTPDGVLVVAREPGSPFQRFRRGEPDADPRWTEIEPLGALGYDGGAIAVAPDGRLAFTTRRGFGWTTGPDVRHLDRGRVVTYRLDAAAYRARWGRVLIDACLPAGTSLTLRFVTSDEDEVPDPLPASPPSRGAFPVPFHDRTPPLPSRLGLERPGPAYTVLRRPEGAERPWEPESENGFATYETPVNAAPGRYLWLVLELAGTQGTTPRVREVRVERPGHALLDVLPRAWSRNEDDASFLHRFLTPVDGLLADLDARAAGRDRLLDPGATPPDALSWLGGLLGVRLDGRWTEPAQRRLLARAFELYRLRGTRTFLERVLGIYLGRPVQVVENWRLAALGGSVLGPPAEGTRPPAVQQEGTSPAALGHFAIRRSGGSEAGDDGTARTNPAHRFTVLVTGELNAEQRVVVNDVVQRHKPAHTVPEICELGSGMRVGRRLHVGLTSFVGPDADWTPAVLGRVVLGEDGVVGTPAVGARLGVTSRAGSGAGDRTGTRVG